MSKPSVFIQAYAILLGTTGLLLLFLPETLGATIPESSYFVVQLVAAALLGFAFANWTARASILGGIYGKAVMVGNQAFAFIGTLVLLTNIPESPQPGFFILLAVLFLGMVLFSTLQFNPSLLDRTKSNR